jgi:hypothetical protein
MRIIIEFEDRGETPMIREEPGAEKPSHVEVLDGGAPPESLLQLMAAEVPELTPGPQPVDVMDAGPPPRWLVEAIQGATPPEVEKTGEHTDAGAAPDI